MSESKLKIPVKVIPNSARNQVLGQTNGVWRIKIAAQPEKGKANKELLEFLSGKLNLRKENLELIKGAVSRNKIIAVTGLELDELSRRLSPD